jgi:hypothetical protein
MDAEFDVSMLSGMPAAMWFTLRQRPALSFP